MDQLNYHHLRYFCAIAKEGNLTRAAEKMQVSQSALSSQLKKLEESLGEPLFDRRKKALHLTEAGRITLDYAETIFSAGKELVDTLQYGTSRKLQVLRIGAVTTLSRNFQLSFVEPLINQLGVEIIIRSGTLREHLRGLNDHTLDVVLANRAVPTDADTTRYSQLLAEQSVSLVGLPELPDVVIPDNLHDLSIILPTNESSVRQAFDLLLDQARVRPRIVAEIDDMAMIRLLSSKSKAYALVPRVVVKDELDQGSLKEFYRFKQIKETFYAITQDRRFPNELVRILVQNMTNAQK